MFQVGYLLMGKRSMYRVIGAGASDIDVIEYSGTQAEEKKLSLIKGEWYSWTNGVGKKVPLLVQVAMVSPSRSPYPVFDFNQIAQAESLIIKGTAYTITKGESATIATPAAWQTPGIQIYNLEKALLAVRANKERKSLSDKSTTAEFFQDGKIIRLSENDVWVVHE